LEYFYIKYGTEHAAFNTRVEACCGNSLFLEVFKVSKSFQLARLGLVESLFRVQFKLSNQIEVFNQLGEMLPGLLICQMRRQNFSQAKTDENAERLFSTVFPKTVVHHLFLSYEKMGDLNFAIRVPLTQETISSIVGICDYLKEKNLGCLDDLRNSYVEVTTVISINFLF